MALTIRSTRLDLIPMTPPVLRSLLAGDFSKAGELLGASVPADAELPCGAMEHFLRKLEADPGFQPWCMRAMVLRAEGVVIGDIGFHSAPGHESLAVLSPGGVEFGFGVWEPWRRRGLATEASEALMRWAQEEHGVTRFVLSISPENVASRGLAAKLGFQKIGWHMDEEDGPEDVFERVEGPEGILNRR